MENPEHDPNDTRLISFTISQAEAAWVDKNITRLKEYDPGFYVCIIDLGDMSLYKIATQHKNLEHEDAKKFLFQLGLRFGKTLKIR